MVPPLTPDEAAELHVASLFAVCERVAEASTLDSRLVVTPDERVDDLRDITPRHVSEAWPQGDGDLGQRLTRATYQAFQEGAGGVILLGADSPTLPTDLLDQAVASLSKHDAVLGPCDDGGYYLLGLRQPLAALFECIGWGGDQVADQTRQRAAAAGIDLQQLPTWYDLDRVDDLARAARDLANTADPSRPFAGALRRCIEDIIPNCKEA